MEQQPVLVIDHTEGGKFYCTVRKTARGATLAGALCRIDIETPSGRQAILARIGLISTHNAVHENPALKPLVMSDGRIPWFSGEADTETTILDPVSCVDLDTGQLAARRANPSSGTPVMLAGAQDVTMFLNEREYLANIGYMPGYPEVTLSVQNKDFGPVEDGGWGEAHHQVTAGQTGSGKTILALVTTACKLVAHPGLGLLIPDTKGDIALDEHNRGSFQFSFLDLLKRGGRTYERATALEIKLESGPLFADLLAHILEPELNTNGAKAHTLAERVTDRFTDEHDQINFSQITVEDVLVHLEQEIPHSFTGEKSREKLRIVHDRMEDPERFRRKWVSEIAPYFTGRLTCAKIARDVLFDGKIWLLDLKSGIEDKVQDAVMQELFRTIVRECIRHFKAGKGRVNALTLLDEAARYVPQSRTDSVAAQIIKDAVNTTRAYGLAWHFITQRLADIDKGILAQAAEKWFGKNLGVGVDREHLMQAIGAQGIEQYDQLSLTGDYFFVGVGQQMNLGAGQSAMPLISWGGDLTEKLIEMNPQIWRQLSWGL